MKQHIFQHLFTVLSGIAVAGMIAGCTPTIHHPAALEQARTPEEFPEAYYRQIEASGKKVAHINPTRSLVTIIVRRGGTLARLGHDHIVASHDVTGFVDLEGGRADLYVPLERLAIDEPDLRTGAGLASPLSDDAIKGTQRNMLEKVLEAERYPFALVRINKLATDPATLSVTITLHGTTKTFKIPEQLETTANEITISGKMSFNQTDFDITPFSILGGALHVQDRLDLRFSVIAAR